MFAFILPFIKFISPAITFLKKILTITLPIPIFVILIIGGWYYFDKNSAIKQAVRKATQELVAGAELKAKDAIIAAKESQIAYIQAANVRQAQRLEITQKSNNNFNQRLTEIVSNNKDLKDKLNEIAKNRGCDFVDDDFLKLLQSDQ